MNSEGGIACGFGDLETKWSRMECFKDAVLTAYGTWMLFASS